CANVANLIFARAFSRRKEVAIRSALGASRGRIVQPLLTESVIIAVCGGALGLVLAHFGIDLLLKFFADKMPRMAEIDLSTPVLLFTLGLSVLTGLLSGLLPALGMIKGDVNESLKQGMVVSTPTPAAALPAPRSFPSKSLSPSFCSSAQDSCCAA